MNRFFKSSFMKNFSWMFAAKIMQLGTSFVVGILVARYLGAANYGLYSQFIALAAIAMNFSAFGLTHLITKEIKQRPEQSGMILGNAMVIRFSASLFMFLLSFALVGFLVKDTLANYLILVICGQLFLISKVYEYYSLAFSKMKAFTLLSSAVLLASGVAKVALVSVNASFTQFLIVLAIEPMVLGLILATYFYRNNKHKLVLEFKADEAILLAKKAFPLVLSSLTAVIYLKVDILMLSYMTTLEQVGVYAVAARLSEIWYFLPPIVAAAAFPRLLELKKNNLEAYKKRLSKIMDAMVLISFSLAIFFTFFAEPIVSVLFGKEFFDSGAILSIHIWAGIFIFLRAIVSKWMLAEELYKFSLITHAIGALTNVALNLYLIPLYGPIGAAIATVISYSIAAYFSLFLSKKARPLAIQITQSLFLFPRLIIKLGGVRKR